MSRSEGPPSFLGASVEIVDVGGRERTCEALAWWRGGGAETIFEVVGLGRKALGDVAGDKIESSTGA